MWTVVTATATDIVTTIHIVRVVAVGDVAVGVRVEVTDVCVSGGVGVVGVVAVVDPTNVAGAGGSRWEVIGGSGGEGGKTNGEGKNRGLRYSSKDLTIDQKIGCKWLGFPRCFSFP
jgi:hypothetical protein